jgi:hypothetical protein
MALVITVYTDPNKNLREDPHGTSGWALREAIPDEIKPSFNTAAFADPGQADIDGASPPDQPAPTTGRFDGQ